MTNTMLEKFIENGLNGKSESTIKTYEHEIKKFKEWLEGSGASLDNYARADVQQYMDYLLAKKKASTTINKIFNAIKKFSKWADKEETIEDIRILKPPSIIKEAPKSLCKKERLSLIRAIDRSGSRRNYAILMVFLNTGIRLGELTRLDRQDIKITERKGCLTVRSGKGYKERVIPLNAETRRALSLYLEERNEKHKALFLSNRGRRISNRSVQHLFEQYGHSVHQLRHTFITALVRGGKDIATIQPLSGHKSADMILRYSQPGDKEKQKAVDSLYFE